MEGMQEYSSCMANLCVRRIVGNVWCPLCNGCCEDTVHSIWWCDVAKEVWKNSIFLDRLNVSMAGSFGVVYNSMHVRRNLPFWLPVLVCLAQQK